MKKDEGLRKHIFSGKIALFAVTLIVVLVVMTLAVASAQDDDGQSGQEEPHGFLIGLIEYKVISEEDKYVELVRCDTGYPFNISIDEYVTSDQGVTYKVTSIGDGAFKGCANIAKVTIPDSVTNLGHDAFNDCVKLTSLVVPIHLNLVNTYSRWEHVYDTFDGWMDKYFSTHIFDNCDRLHEFTFTKGSGEWYTYVGKEFHHAPWRLGMSKLTISDGIEEMNPQLGECIYSLEELTLPISLDVVGDTGNPIFNHAFRFNKITFTPGTGTPFVSSDHKLTPWCKAGKRLGTVIFSEGIKSIGKDMFNGCEGLKSVSFPSTIVEIGDGAFKSCKKLSSIDIPEGLTYLGASAFEKCVKLKNIKVPGSVLSVGDKAFKGCSALEDAVLEKGIAEIGAGAFQGCKKLKSVQFGDGLQTICKDAFHDCKALKSVVLPATTKTVKNSAFEGCSSIKSLDLGNVSFAGERAFMNCKSIGSLKIPVAMTELQKSVFEGCSGIKEIELSDITSIGDYALKGCKNIKTIHLPDSLTHIGKRAFMNCSGLKEIHFGNGLKSMDDEAFKGFNFYSADKKSTLKANPDNLKGNVFTGKPSKMVLKKT